MTATKFEGKLFTDEDVVFPSMKDYYHNSLEPILKSYLMKDQEYKYFEDPIGGEDAVGFVTDNRGVFAIKCTKEAFDLSADAQNTAETSADSFLFYPKNKTVNVGQSAESQKYIYQLCKNEELFANDKFNFQDDLEKLKEYKKRIRFSLMCVSVPKLPRCSIELLPNEDIEEIKYSDLNKFASNYFFLTHRPDFDKSNEVIPYAPSDTLYFYKNRQVWKKCDSLKITGYSYYYVLANRPGITTNIYKTSLKIRNDILALINESEDIRINIPSDITAANANRYTEYSADNINNLPFIGGIISSILLPNKQLISDYYTENTYMHAGFNCAGQDKFNKTIAVIYVKVTRNGKKRWINLNKYILVKYFGEVKNQTTNTTDYVGTDFYIKNAPPEFKPDTYNIGISCYQDEVSRKSLVEMGQSDERIKIQKKAFAAAGYSLCQNYDDLYNWTVSIGDVSFFVPPTQIRVTNTTNTDRLPILRARGTMAKNIEKAETEIAIDLYFNNEAGINGQPVEMDLWTKHFKDEGELYSSSSEAFKTDETKKKEGDNGLRTYYMNGLRALLSEFRFCPFLPIINKYINETLKISAVSLEQILVKTVPNFPRLLKVVLVMKNFDYQVYMPEVPEAYYNENNKVVNPFDQCINYDVLRYYYQKPILYGNELAKKLKQGKTVTNRQITENGKTKTIEVTEEYSFNSIPFIKDTIIGDTKNNVRTAFLPCEFKDPTIAIYAADETYLQQLHELKRTLYQKRMSMGFGVDSFIPNENQKKIIAEASSLYKIVNPIIEKYALIKNNINVSAQNEIYKKSLKDSTLNDEINQTTVDRAAFVDLDSLKFPYGAKVEKDGYSEPIIRDNYFETIYKCVTDPLHNELIKETKELTNIDNEKLVSQIYFVVNNTRICPDIESLKKELASYGSNIPKVQINIGLNLTINQKEVDEIAKQAYVGEQKEEYKALENQKNNLLDHNGNAAVKIYLPDTSAGQFSSLSFNTDFDEWNRAETDLKFLEFCNYNEDSLINANEKQQELKQSIDYEDAKSIKFKKILENALVTDFEASLNNNFARISLLESSGSAAQYVGGSDIHISWHIRTQDSDLVNVLKSLPDYEAHCMRNYHNVLPCFPIRIESEFSKLMGVFEVSIEDVVVETVPNFPGLYDVSIRAISTDRTLRNRESLRAINDDNKYNKNPELENAEETDDDYIDNSGIKRGKIRTRINIRTQNQLYDKMANAELYPDLELPRVDDLVKLGFRFIRYKDKEREINSGFVDPDFYMYYSHIIFSELLKKYLDTKFGRSELEDENKGTVKEFKGIVTEVEDGDTCTVRIKDGSELRKIRLDMIDTPEIWHEKSDEGSQLEQAGGREATTVLQEMIYLKEVTVKYREKDVYGRYLGRIYVGSIDVNKEMVRLGWAWHNSKYDTSDEYDKFAQLQKEAIENKLGIFNPLVYERFNPILYKEIQSIKADIYKAELNPTDPEYYLKIKEIETRFDSNNALFDEKFDDILNKFLNNEQFSPSIQEFKSRLKTLQDKAANLKQIIPYPIEPWKTRSISKQYIANGNTSIISGGKPSMLVSDLTGCRVEVDWTGEINMETANSKFKNVVTETKERIKEERKALHQITTQNLLAQTIPAISVADKKLWTVSNKILCSFKESYIVNLDRMLKDGNKKAINHNQKQYKNLDTYFDETFKKTKACANEIILGNKYGLKTFTSLNIIDKYSFFVPDKYDNNIDVKVEDILLENGNYIRLLQELYIASVDKRAFFNDFIQAIKAILKSIKAINTASQEYNYEVKNEAWKGCQYKDRINSEPYYGVLFSGENGTKNDHEKNSTKFRLNGPFNIRRYSYNEFWPYLSSEELEEIHSLPNYESKHYVIDPYYRLKSNEEIADYLTKCREDIRFAAETEFRIILWWLARLYQEDIFPSLSYDIERKNAKNNADASKKAVELINSQLKKANENQSFTVNTKLIEKIGTFIEQNEAALDTGKFFVAALFAILDEPFSKSNLYNHIVARNYDWLNNYIIKLTSRESTDRAGIADKNGTKLRKFLLALCGYEFIDDPSYIGKSSEVTPAEQFSSIYNTKLALAACEDPNMYLFHSYYDMLRNDYRGRLLRAFPTYYCMFIDEGREIGLWKIFDNFYSMTGINEISITKSRKIAADTCSITLSNNYNTFTFDDEDCYINYVGDFWGELYDSLFDQKSLALEMDRKRRHATKYINRAKLSPGIRIHVRMGYGSDARELAGLFNGVIAEVNPNAKTVEVVAQGNGIELLNPISLETDADEITQIDDAGLFKAASSGGTPRNILAGMLTTKSSLLARYVQGEYDVNQSWNKDGEKHWDTDFMFGLGDYLNSLHESNILGIKHFGEVDDRSVFPGGEICQNLYDITEFPALDDDELNFYRSNKEENSHAPYISFNPNGRTFWDAMHICKSVGPDFICSTAPFDFRDTIFLGRPRYYYAYEYVETESEARVERRKPFQQHYFLYGNSDIIVNDITASSKLMKTVATGIYTRDRGVTSDTEQVGPIFVDKDIYPEEQKSFIYDTRLTLKPEPKWYNFRTTTKQNTINDGKWLVTDSIGSTIGKGLRNTAQFFANIPDQLLSYLDDVPDKVAWSATASALKDSIKEMYQGGLVVIGYPSIKPYDRLYVNDAYNDISGQVEVRDVVHLFSIESGLISSINVDAISVVDDRKEFYTQNMSCRIASEAAFAAVSTGIYKLQPKIVASIATKGSKYLGKIGNIAGSISSDARLVGLKTFFNSIKESAGTTAEIIKDKGLIKSMAKAGVSATTKLTNLKTGLAFFGMTPPGWLAIGTWLAIEAGLHVIAHNIQSSLMFNVKNSQALIIFPLKRYGMVYTAGLSGSMGLVYGSPTFNDVGPIEKLYTEWLAPSEEDGWLTGILKATFLSEDVQNEATKYRRDNTAFFANNGNSIGDEIQAESTVFGVAKNRGSGKFSSIYGMSTQNRINPFEDNLDEEEKAKVLERYNNSLKDKAIVSMEDFTAPKIYNNFRNIVEDIRFRKYVGPKESPNGFLRILHLEKQLDINKGIQGVSGIYHKDASNTRSLNIPYIRYNDGKIYDIPYLSLDAFNVLHEIVEKAYQSVVKINRADNTQVKADFGNNHIILFSALRIGSESDKAVASGNTFTIKAIGNLNLGKILNELYENNGKKVFYSDQKGDGQYKITVFPLDYVAKN